MITTTTRRVLERWLRRAPRSLNFSAGAVGPRLGSSSLPEGVPNGEGIANPRFLWILGGAASGSELHRGAGPTAPSGFCGWSRQQSVRRSHSLSRDWLVQLWLEEKKGSSGRPGGSNRRRKRMKRVAGDAEESGEGGADGWSSPLAAFRRAFLSGPAPALQRVRTGEAVEPPLPPPASQYGGGVPFPGSPEEVKLVPLLARANLLITRDVEWANIMFAFEQESKYAIVDPSYPGSPVGFIHEQSNIIYRQFLHSRRPFIAYITDARGNEIFRVRRPFWWINSTIYAEVDSKDVGVVHRRWHFWRRIYDLYLGKKQFAVVENPGFWNWTFTLKDNNENVLAEINRDWRGVGFELFTDAGQYVIRFGHAESGAETKIEELDAARPLTLSERAVAVALAVSLDCDYFSRRGGWGLPFIAAGE